MAIADLYVTEQRLLTLFPSGTSVQVADGLKAPVPSEVKVTVPLGLDFVPVSVSVTTAVHVVEVLIATTTGLHEIVVEVVRLFTVRGVEPELVAWTVSPP